MMRTERTYMLMILDGWGLSPVSEGNAVMAAQTPFLDRLLAQYPHTRLICSGEAVGLPQGIMGNSEVGHLNIGAGRVVYQDLLRIDRAVRDGSFFHNPVLSSAMEKVREKQAALHLMGLVSDGGVHSQLTHLLALLDMAREKGLSKVCVHAILDGRDTAPADGIRYVKTVQEHMHRHNFGAIASICGRYYAMDRDKRWDRIEKAFHLYVSGEGLAEKDPVQAVQNAYDRGETDEFVKPVVLQSAQGSPIGSIQDGDGLIFFNFRADRAREISRALAEPDFDFFPRPHVPKFCEYVTMTLYDETFAFPIAFPQVHLKGILGEIISENGLRQLRIAETEKYAHVTYFFNGGEEKPFPLEDRCLIPSPRDVPTYDFKPEMSAREVTEEVLARLRSREYHFIVLNFANMDMVGHTGVMEAAVKACETVDKCAERIVSELLSQGGAAIVTADHGNAEKMLDENGNVHTAHTLNPVRLVLADDTHRHVCLREGVLGDIAPTLLDMMGIEKSEQMSGESLIVKC
ncbi:MAG: 2,3-bisphosphoglycerate-independent phosphoglycerate mutase [Desulfobacterales bacterium]